MKIAKALLGTTCLALACHAQAETLTIATVNNADMIRMQRLSETFEKTHPDSRCSRSPTAAASAGSGISSS